MKKSNKLSALTTIIAVISTSLNFISGNSSNAQVIRSRNSSRLHSSKVQVIRVDSHMKVDPLIVNGKSGGNQRTNCGFITAKPNKVIQILESLPYLRLTVEGTGKPTLLIEGPGGRFCVLADNYSGSKTEISGYWEPGRYSLHIGDISEGHYTYTLSISQRKTPK